MPGPNGIITISDNPDWSLKTKKITTSLALEAQAEALVAEEQTELRAKVDKDTIILSKRSKSTSFKPGDEVVEFQVHPVDPAKTTSIRTGLDDTLEDALRDFL